MTAHPDRGGSVEAFQRLDAAYNEIQALRAKMDDVDIFADIFNDIAKRKERRP